MNYTPVPEREPEFTIKCPKCDGKALAFMEYEYSVTLAIHNNIFTYTYRCLNNHVTEVKIKEKNPIDNNYEQPV